MCWRYVTPAREREQLPCVFFGVWESWVRRIQQERREQGKIAPSSTRRRRKKWSRTHRGFWLSSTSVRIFIYGNWSWRPKKNWAGKSRT
jgi:hypothetical protein